MIKNCERCGEPYETKVPHLARYCSKCRRIVRNETRQRRYHNNIEFERERARLRYHQNVLPSPPRIKNCALCGQEFEAKTSAKYCLTCRVEKKRELARLNRRKFYEQHREQERLRKERQILIARYFAWRKRHGKS